MEAATCRTGWRGRAAGAAAGLLTAVTWVAGPAAAASTEPLVTDSPYTDTREVQASDAVAASIAFSRLAFPSGADEVVLAGEHGSPDAFASGLLQSSRPLLLTGSGGLDPRTVLELRRLGAVSVLALGGSSALGEEVIAGVAELGLTVRRLSGATRVQTAVAIADDQAPRAPVAILARAWPRPDEADSAMFVDAMVAGGWSAAGGFPVLLTGTDRIAEETVAYLERAAVERVHVVGGRAAVSETAAAQLAALGIQLERVAGPSRFDTGAEVALRRGEARRFVLVDGDGEAGWTAGFAAAAYSARHRAPILPVSREGLSSSAEAVLGGDARRHGLVCGPGVPDEVCHRAAEASGQVRRAEAALAPAEAGVLGGQITNPTGVSAITVIGCGVKQSIHPDDSGQFRLPLTKDGCRLTVRIEHTDGTAFDQAFTVGQGMVRPHQKAPVVEPLPLPDAPSTVPGAPADEAAVIDPVDGGEESDAEPGDGGAVQPPAEDAGDAGEAGDAGDGEPAADEGLAEPAEQPSGEEQDSQDADADAGEEEIAFDDERLEGGLGVPTGADGEESSEATADPAEPEPTEEPTPEPTEEPTPEPTEEPTPEPTPEPTAEPTSSPTPTPSPTSSPTPSPSPSPTSDPDDDVPIGCQATMCSGPSLPGGGGSQNIEMM